MGGDSDDDSPTMKNHHPNGKKKFTGRSKPGHKVELKQGEQNKGEQNKKKLSNYQGFNIEQWETDKNEIEDSIEEQFDINHDQLLNLQQPNQDQPESIVKPRQPDLNQNPMYIEFELNNDDEPLETEVQGEKTETQPLFCKNDTNLYQKLESSRREERRPFSPPFKVEKSPTTLKNEDDFELEENIDKPQLLKVQRTQILRDSLDM